MEEGEGKGWRARRPFFLPSPPLLLLLLLLEIRLIFPAFSSGRNVNEITRRKLEVAELLNLYLLSRARLERSGPVIYPFLFFLRLTTRLRNMGRLPSLPSPSSPPLFFLRPRAAINFPASSPRRVLPPPKPQERKKDRETDRSDGERESVLLEYQQTTTQHTTTDDG